MKEGKSAPDNQINVLCGFHSVEAALVDPRSLGELLHDATRRDPRLSRLLGLAKSKGVTLHRATRAELDALSGGIRHQGLIGLLNRAPAGKLPASRKSKTAINFFHFAVGCKGCRGTHLI